MSEQALNTALAAPKQAVYLEADKKNVMSVDIPVFHYKTRTADENDIYSYGFAFTSSDLDGAVKSLADILPDMLRLSETEKACQLMAAEIEKTRRRVNALEHVIIPEARKNIKYITMKLDENERSTQIRDEGEGYDAGGGSIIIRRSGSFVRDDENASSGGFRAVRGGFLHIVVKMTGRAHEVRTALSIYLCSLAFTTDVRP